MSEPRYDRIGHGYAARRQEDPWLRSRIHAALGGAASVVNVGAGTGGYEPEWAHVVAVEPSQVMAMQRPTGRPAIRGMSHALPLFDQSVDAAMAVLSIHHWHPHLEAGLGELCRVARQHVVIVTIDPLVCGAMWLMADYLHEVRDMDYEIFPSCESVINVLDRPADVEVVPVHRDTPDHTLMSFWAHPERVLDPVARQVTSGFARQPEAVVERVVSDVRRDLESGVWDEKYGHLRTVDQYDSGLRLIHASR